SRHMDGLGKSVRDLPGQVCRVSLVDSQTGSTEEATLQGTESCPLVPPRRDSPSRIRSDRRVSHDQGPLHLRETPHRRQAPRISLDMDDHSLDPTGKRGRHGSPSLDLCGRRGRGREAGNSQGETGTGTWREIVQDSGGVERAGTRRSLILTALVGRDSSENGRKTTQNILEFGV